MAFNLGLHLVNIYGDGKIIIDGISGKSCFHPNGLQGWVYRVKKLLTKINDLPMQHIYRENNSHVDVLSKKGLSVHFGSIHISHFRDAQLLWNFELPFP